jgi:hypothetical protein
MIVLLLSYRMSISRMCLLNLNTVRILILVGMHVDLTDCMIAQDHNLEHIQHCFDYLRQALMCAADSNLEDVTTKDGGASTLGWGSKRVCRDYEALKQWSETWRAADVAGIS